MTRMLVCRDLPVKADFGRKEICRLSTEPCHPSLKWGYLGDRIVHGWRAEEEGAIQAPRGGGDGDGAGAEPD